MPVCTPRSRAPARIWLLTLAVGVVAALAWAAVLAHYPELAGRLRLPWPVVAGAIAAAGLPTVTFSFVKGSAEIGMHEIPVVVGIVFLPPLWLLVAVAIGYPLSYLIRRRSPSKAVFNTVNSVAGAAAAVAAYRGVLGADSPVGLRGWAAVLAAVTASDAASAVAVILAIAVSSRRVPGREVVAGLRATAVGLPVAALLAVIAVTVIWTDRAAGLLVAGLGALAAVSQRSGNELRSRFSNLERLYGFTEHTSILSEMDALVPDLLSRARDIMVAEEIELVIVLPARSVRYRLDARDRIEQESGARSGRFEKMVATREVSVLAPRAGGDAEVAEALAERGLRDAIAAPITVADGGRGCLIVGNHRGPASFDEDDRRLFDALAAHSGVAIRGSSLLQQLQGEVVARCHQALHDGLTGLANRTMFIDTLREALAHRPVGGLVSVMLMDLDGFKEVNDTLGHHTGDIILQEAATRLAAAVGDAGLVARLGGDEFAIVHPAVADEAEAVDRAQQALARLGQPLALDGLLLGLRASVGVSIAPDHGDDVSMLMRRADVAMYGAKASGDGVSVYDKASDRHSTRRLVLATELRQALDGDGLEVWFQPQADLRSGAITGAEALLRWHHPVHGAISPVEFIPVAEQSGLIDELTWWVLDVAVAQARAWHDHGLPLGVAVNISARSLLDGGIVDRLERLLGAAGLDPEWLTLEITESSIMSDPDRSQQILVALAGTGVQLAIDDFGTGYSSLSRLKRLPIHAVKIDKSFVLQMGSDRGDAAIVRSTIDLARNMGHTVVAEGVENQSTWDQLRALGCDAAQGYLLARAMPADRFEEWARHRRTGNVTLLRPVGEAPGA